MSDQKLTKLVIPTKVDPGTSADGRARWDITDQDGAIYRTYQQTTADMLHLSVPVSLIYSPPMGHAKYNTIRYVDRNKPTNAAPARPAATPVTYPPAAQAAAPASASVTTTYTRDALKAVIREALHEELGAALDQVLRAVKEAK